MSNLGFRTRRAFLASAALLALAAAGSAQAQSAPSGGQQPGSSSAGESPDGGEIIVTATRDAQFISKVPLSISAFSQEKLDKQGVKTIADLAAITPGVTFGNGAQRNSVSIRGVTSRGGAGTTGIYIDETPIQIYNVGSFPQDSLPALFDLDRVEILRGPQGTLFGSGSMGGTVRYITPRPGLKDYSVYARGETSFTDGGDPSYEAGLAVGGPIVTDKLGFRASGYARQDGGWIDRVTRTGTIVDKNSNWGRAYSLRLALMWKPIDALEITPAVFYQNRYQNSGSGWPSNGPDVSWQALSDPQDGRYGNGGVVPSPDRDHSTLYTLTAKLDLGGQTLISNSAYYDRKELLVSDMSPFEAGVWLGGVDAFGTAVPGIPGYLSTDTILNTKRGFTQEVRLQSDPEARLRWVIGGFYSKSKQFNEEKVYSPDFPQGILTTYGLTIEEFLGVPMLPGDISYVADLGSHEEQLAGFAEFNFKLTDKLSLTAGIRKSRLKFDYDYFVTGPYNSGTTTAAAASSESPWTPKFGISYQADDNNLFYATVAKGFRNGGANIPFPLDFCRADLNNFGLATPPDNYRSDSLWSYEIGAKNKLMGGRLQVASSIFRIDWSNIQNRVVLPSCGYYFVANLGKARNQGFDLQAQARVTDNFNLGMAVGYNDAKYTGTIALLSGKNFITKGDHLPGSPWTVTVTGDADFDLAGHKSYFHGEYRYASSYPGLVEQNPLNAAFFPGYYDRPATNLVFLRAGMKFGDLDAALFVNNLLNSHTMINRSRDGRSSPLFYIRNLQPRVIGLTLTYRQ